MEKKLFHKVPINYFFYKLNYINFSFQDNHCLDYLILKIDNFKEKLAYVIQIHINSNDFLLLNCLTFQIIKQTGINIKLSHQM